jgi:hypothetical protein
MRGETGRRGDGEKGEKGKHHLIKIQVFENPYFQPICTHL